MGSIPNGSAPLQACARQIIKSTLPGRTRRRKFELNILLLVPASELSGERRVHSYKALKCWGRRQSNYIQLSYQ
jgi:hypothetical protein